jgi:hypothetical protein
VRVGAEERQVKYTLSTTGKRTTTKPRRLPVETFPPGDFIGLDALRELQVNQGLLAAD